MARGDRVFQQNRPKAADRQRRISAQVATYSLGASMPWMHPVAHLLSGNEEIESCAIVKRVDPQAPPVMFAPPVEIRGLLPFRKPCEICQPSSCSPATSGTGSDPYRLRINHAMPSVPGGPRPELNGQTAFARGAFLWGATKDGFQHSVECAIVQRRGRLQCLHSGHPPLKIHRCKTVG